MRTVKSWHGYRLLPMNYQPWAKCSYFYHGCENAPTYEYNGYVSLCYEHAIEQFSRWNHVCFVCGNFFEEKHYWDKKESMLCPKCKPLYYAELQRVKRQNARTKDLGLASDLSLREWLEIVSTHGNKCAYCGEEWSDMDHRVPVARGGGTTKHNVVPSCRRCNIDKRDREFLEFQQ